MPAWHIETYTEDPSANNNIHIIIIQKYLQEQLTYVDMNFMILLPVVLHHWKTS